MRFFNSYNEIGQYFLNLLYLIAYSVVELIIIKHFYFYFKFYEEYTFIGFVGVCQLIIVISVILYSFFMEVKL